VNIQSFACCINKVLIILCPNAVDDTKSVLLYTDAAPYMLVASALLKGFHSRLIHDMLRTWPE
jgi:sensor domain CHASE-containing protein